MLQPLKLVQDSLWSPTESWLVGSREVVCCAMLASHGAVGGALLPLNVNHSFLAWLACLQLADALERSGSQKMWDSRFAAPSNSFGASALFTVLRLIRLRDGSFWRHALPKRTVLLPSGTRQLDHQFTGRVEVVEEMHAPLATQFTQDTC